LEADQTGKWIRLGRFWLNTKTVLRIPVIQGGKGTPAFDQDRFRFRNDDGDGSTATWAADINTNIAWPLAANIRLRLAIQETAGVAASNQEYYLYYSVNSAAYTSVYPGSYYPSTYFVDEAQDGNQRLGTGQTFRGGGLNDSAQIGTGGWIDFSGPMNTKSSALGFQLHVFRATPLITTSICGLAQPG
jgi:hypothetical protein